MPTADGGRAISDAVTEAYYVINMGRRLAGLDPVYPKNGARFHFEFTGAVQGFRVDNTQSAGGNLRIENVSGHSQAGKHSLALRYDHVSPGCPVCARTSTFIPIDLGDMGHYELLASLRSTLVKPYRHGLKRIVITPSRSPANSIFRYTTEMIN